MSETETAPVAAPATSTPKKAAKSKGSGGSAKPKAAKAKPSHPKTADMVTAAIKNLKERGGSSLQAIKKYIGANYKVDAEKMAPFIRKYLKSAVTSGSLVQTKGKGASGSFKLPTSGEKPAAKKKASKPSATKSGELKAKKAKTASAAPKKTPAVKKSASSVPKKAPAKEKAAKAATPSKAKKAKKAPTKKPKAPKPKKVSASKPKAAKKAAGGSKKK